jgi:hypothetical protein
VWKEGGDVCNHSKLETTSVSFNAVNNSDVFQGLEGAVLFAANASKITYTNINTPTNDIKLPIELIAFQPVNASA